MPFSQFYENPEGEKQAFMKASWQNTLTHRLHREQLAWQTWDELAPSQERQGCYQQRWDKMLTKQKKVLKTVSLHLDSSRQTAESVSVTPCLFNPVYSSYESLRSKKFNAQPLERSPQKPLRVNQRSLPLHKWLWVSGGLTPWVNLLLSVLAAAFC